MSVILSRGQTVNLSALKRGEHVTPVETTHRQVSNLDHMIGRNDLRALALHFRNASRKTR